MTMWNVTIELAGTGDAVPPPRLAALATALSAYSAAVTGSPEEPLDGRPRYGAALTIEAADAVEAVATARRLFGEAAASQGLPDWPAVVVEAVEESELDRRLEEPAFPVLLGVRELAELLQVTPQRASALARSRSFPKPVAMLASGPVWAEPNVRRFVAEWQRRPGPRKVLSVG